MSVYLIAAMDDCGGIGKEGNLPWRSSMDLQFFKHMTKGQIVVMGRKTYESLPNGPLPDRINWVVSRNGPEGFDGKVHWFQSLEAMLGHYFCSCADQKELWVIGGAEIYRQAIYWPCLDGIVRTWFKTKVEDCDAFFPFDVQKPYQNLKQHVCEGEPEIVFSFLYKNLDQAFKRFGEFQETLEQLNKDPLKRFKVNN